MPAGSGAGFEDTVMTALLDVDQLRTFIAIAETGSFTRAADIVHKTQSAVSMQMKRLEERLDRSIFARDGRASKLTEDGERLLDYARRIVKLNVETIAAFSDELTGRVRLGVPDDYADRYLPEIMARFSRAYPAIELTVICEETICLLERIKANELDLAIITNCSGSMTAENFRQERLLWATSNRHSTHLEERLPLALGRPTCDWRRASIECLESIGRPYRVLYSSGNASAIAAAVLAGLAVSVFPEFGTAARHARALGRGRLPRAAVLPHRAGAQSARAQFARRRARRARHLVARQPVGGGASRGVANQDRCRRPQHHDVADDHRHDADRGGERPRVAFREGRGGERHDRHQHGDVTGTIGADAIEQREVAGERDHRGEQAEIDQREDVACRPFDDERQPAQRREAASSAQP